MYARKVKEIAQPGCRRRITRGRWQAEWESIVIDEFVEGALVTVDGEEIPFADIFDMMGEVYVEGHIECRMPFDNEAERLFNRGGWDQDTGFVECGNWFPSNETLEAHQADHHKVWIDENDRQAGQIATDGPMVVEVDIIPERQGGGEPTSRGVEPASDKQIAFIESLAARKGVEANPVVTKEEASAEIERLMDLPDVEAFRRNKYDAPCSECGNIVEAETGVLRQVDGKWLVGHSAGCPDEPNLPAEVPDGFYAVDNSDGDTSFYRVKQGKKPGVVFIDLVLGGGFGERLVRQPAPYRQRDAILGKIVEAGFEAASERFGRELQTCARCGRHLTDETSREIGLGPECRKK